MNRRKTKNICAYLTMSVITLFSSLSINAQNLEIRGNSSYNTGQSSVITKVSYNEVLPEITPVDKVELERIKELAEKDISAAAEEIKKYEDTAMIPVLRELLDIYYADAKKS